MALALDQVAALTVVARHQLATGGERGTGGGVPGLALLAHRLLGEAEQQRRDRVGLALAHAEVRHLVELAVGLDQLLALVPDPRPHHLGAEPARLAVLDLVDVPEVEQVQRLRGLLRELDADRLGVLEAGDGVAAGAAVLGDGLLAEVERLLLLAHLGDVRLALLDGLELLEVALDQLGARGGVHRLARRLLPVRLAAAPSGSW